VHKATKPWKRAGTPHVLRGYATFGAHYHSFAAFLVRSNCLITAKLRRPLNNVQSNPQQLHDNKIISVRIKSWTVIQNTHNCLQKLINWRAAATNINYQIDQDKAFHHRHHTDDSQLKQSSPLSYMNSHSLKRHISCWHIKHNLQDPHIHTF